jgi:4-phospho-D-threonate 3-dehydrogenase / 4-phospho-D-erythronate 3-dehydrogenase
MGDPAGIGPEVTVRALGDSRIFQWCRPLVVGHPEMLRRAIALVGCTAIVREIEVARDAQSSPKSIDCVRTGSDEVLAVAPATIDGRSGHAAYLSLIKAVELAQAGAIDGIVTAPLHKAALHQAGHEYPGHTELLAERCGVRDFAMMLYLGSSGSVCTSAGLGVAHVTLHMALRDVPAHLSSDAVQSKIELLDQMMRRLKGAAPRLGVAALNPHGGEEGLFGDEEPRIIAPAVQQARKRGVQVEGPFPTDTLMVRAVGGEFDGVVAMYHDQGHIALKLMGFDRAVNVTLGLPIVRTSVAHGTAFDIAWKGVARATSMVEAIRVASVLAKHATHN